MNPTATKYTAEESKAHAIKRRTEQKAAKSFLETTLAETPRKAMSLADLQARFKQDQRG